MKYITMCCKFIFYGLNHSPEKDGTCRNCGGVYGQLAEANLVRIKELEDEVEELMKDYWQDRYKIEVAMAAELARALTKIATGDHVMYQGHIIAREQLGRKIK